MRNVNPDHSPLLVRSREAARMLAISERTLWTMTKSGRLPCVRLQGSVRYKVDTLLTWVTEQEQKSALQN
jgi:excisionase family DNA binding protein